TLPKISFDYAVVEKEPAVQVVRYAGQWKDLGTWNTLTEAMERPDIGNAVMDKSCSNTHIMNDLDIPVLAIGLSDVVVAASPQGILVSNKEQSSYMKPLVDRLEQPVMFAEKSWGSYRVLDVQTESLTVKVTLRQGHRMSYHSHQRRNEVWVVVSGTGRTVVDGMEQEIHAGDVIAIQAGCRHTVMAETDLGLMEVQLGRGIRADDKQKYPLEL
ncbi:MAG: cupin domain-containing protein, partial [Oscillibacter sp.]|nr:cupin domain-containing protein [Oscillibacter sp.]